MLSVRHFRLPRALTISSTPDRYQSRLNRGTSDGTPANNRSVRGLRNWGVGMNRDARISGRFYTPDDVAAELISMVEQVPTTVLDLGCGAGALSHAAVRRWGSQLDLLTVDVDKKAGPKNELWAYRHRHFTADVLATDPFRGLLRPQTYDLAVLNPPYGRARSDGRSNNPPPPSRPDMMSLAKHCRATAFMLHALKAVRLGGTVAAILPESLATSTSCSPRRSAISRYASIERLAVLPARTFASTETRAVMVIMRRTSERLATDEPWWPPEGAPSVVARGGAKTLRDLGVEVARGRLNTVEARKAGAFHLDGFRTANDGLVSFESNSKATFDPCSAREGDILIARVGRGIPERVVRVSSGVSAISDCIFRLRCPPDLAHRVWAGLRSDTGRDQLSRAQTGLTARFLPMNCLLSVRV